MEARKAKIMQKEEKSAPHPSHTGTKPFLRGGCLFLP
jgi:hypothetical protein